MSDLKNLPNLNLNSNSKVFFYKKLNIFFAIFKNHIKFSLMSETVYNLKFPIS